MRIAVRFRASTGRSEDVHRAAAGEGVGVDGAVLRKLQLGQAGAAFEGSLADGGTVSGVHHGHGRQALERALFDDVQRGREGEVRGAEDRRADQPEFADLQLVSAPYGGDLQLVILIRSRVVQREEDFHAVFRGQVIVLFL